MPQPRLDLTEAEFELSFKFTLAMVLYVGVPKMGGIVGNGNRPRSCRWWLEW